MHEPLPEDQEGIVYADLDLGMISLAKAAADPAGHYARPDVTRLLLDQDAGRPRGGAQPRRDRGLGAGRDDEMAPMPQRDDLAEVDHAAQARRDKPRGLASGIRHSRAPAVPAHAPRRVPDDYVPPYPSFVARHAPSVTRVVMAYFGAQSREGDRAALAVDGQ